MVRINPRLAFGPGAVVVIVIIVVVIVVFGFGLNSDEENRIILECEKLKDRCEESCFPDDPTCVQECQREAEGCRSNMSTSALEALIEVNEAHMECAEEYENCPFRCYGDFVDFITDDGELKHLEGEERQEASELLQSSQMCEMGCDPAFAACEENHGH